MTRATRRDLLDCLSGRQGHQRLGHAAKMPSEVKRTSGRSGEDGSMEGCGRPARGPCAPSSPRSENPCQECKRRVSHVGMLSNAKRLTNLAR